MNDRNLMQMALDALILNNQEWKELAEQSGRWKAEDQDHYHHTELTIKALRDRLAQPEPPEVIWLTFHEPPMVFRNRDDALAFCQDGEQPIPMYSSPQPYDQTALELCDVCGWKTIIPEEGCLNCKRLAQPNCPPCNQNCDQGRRCLNLLGEKHDC